MTDGHDIVPEVTVEEIERDLKQMHNGKAGDQSGLVVEMIQRGSKELFQLMAMMFSENTSGRSQPPEIWKQSVIKVFFKKGDATLPDNYRAITVLRITCKVFALILSGRLKSFLDERQGPDQAGFRKMYGCDGNLFVIVQLIEILSEYRLPLWLCAIVFRKAFDTAEELRNQGVPGIYVDVLRS